MKPESIAWLSLQDQAAALLRPGFADRTLRSARALAPTFGSQCLLSAATAAICLVVLLWVNTQLSQAETARNLAGWEAFAAESQDLSFNQ